MVITTVEVFSFWFKYFICLASSYIRPQIYILVYLNCLRINFQLIIPLLILLLPHHLHLLECFSFSLSTEEVSPKPLPILSSINPFQDLYMNFLLWIHLLPKYFLTLFIPLYLTNRYPSWQCLHSKSVMNTHRLNIQSVWEL